MILLSLWCPRDPLSAVGSRRGAQGLLEVLCGFPRRRVLKKGMGEGSKLEGRPGAPLLVYSGSSQSEEYRGDHRPLSSANSCNRNAAATAGCLRLPSGVCAARNLPAKGGEAWKSTWQVSPTSMVSDSRATPSLPLSPPLLPPQHRGGTVVQ